MSQPAQRLRQSVQYRQYVYARPCTAKTTIYCAGIAAGLTLAQFTKLLRGLPVEADVQVNLLSMELSVAELSVSAQ